MRTNGFVYGALLMEKWFRRPPAIKPNYSSEDSTTIKMDWVLKFPRARSAYNNIFSRRAWLTPNAQAEIRKDLQMRGYLTPRSGFDFQPPGTSMTELDKSYITSQSVSSGYGYGNALETLAMDLHGYQWADDLLAALGSFSFHVVVRGRVMPTTSNKSASQTLFLVTIEEVGVYVKDSYDFNKDAQYNDQDLGYWDEVTSTVRATPIYGVGGWFVKVTNASFRDFRDEHQRGGDFMVYSDIKWTHLPVPETFMTMLGPIDREKMSRYQTRQPVAG